MARYMRNPTNAADMLTQNLWNIRNDQEATCAGKSTKMSHDFRVAMFRRMVKKNG